MKKLLKYSLLSSAILAVLVDTLLISCEMNFCQMGGFEYLMLGGLESLIYYPAFVFTYFVGGSTFGLDESLINIWTNLFFLISEFIYLFIVIFSVGTLFLSIRKIFGVFIPRYGKNI